MAFEEPADGPENDLGATISVHEITPAGGIWGDLSPQISRSKF